MMFSATDFLPDSIRTLTNLATSVLPNFGSGRISRLGTSRRRGISIPSYLQLSADSALAKDPHGLSLTRPSGRLNLTFKCDLDMTRPQDYLLAPALARFAPYFERACLRSFTPWVSSAPRT